MPIMSAMRFIKLLFQYKQPEAFTELAREMLQVLSVSSTQASTAAPIIQFNVCSMMLSVSLCLSLSGCGRSIIQECRAGPCFT